MTIIIIIIIKVWKSSVVRPVLLQYKIVVFTFMSSMPAICVLLARLCGIQIFHLWYVSGYLQDCGIHIFPFCFAAEMKV